MTSTGDRKSLRRTSLNILREGRKRTTENSESDSGWVWARRIYVEKVGDSISLASQKIRHALEGVEGKNWEKGKEKKAYQV